MQFRFKGQFKGEIHVTKERGWELDLTLRCRTDFKVLCLHPGFSDSLSLGAEEELQTLNLLIYMTADMRQY